MEASGVNASILSSFCDALPEFDCQGPAFPPVEEHICDPYSPAYTYSVEMLDGLVHSSIDSNIMK